LELAPRRGRERAGDLDDAAIVEIKPDHRPGRARVRRLLLERQDALLAIELDDAVALGIADAIAEDGGARRSPRRLTHHLRQPVAIDHIVAEHESRALAGEQIAADEKGLREAAGLGLDRIAKRNAPLAAVAQERGEKRRIRRRGDDEN